MYILLDPGLRSMQQTSLTFKLLVALIPIMLYAFLHALNFAIKSANEFGYSNSSLVSKANQLKLQHTSNILSTIACAEIFVFPIIIVMIFMYVYLFVA